MFLSAHEVIPTPVVFQLSDGRLTVQAEAISPAPWRLIKAEDTVRLQDWTTWYRALLGQAAPEARLLELGRQMYPWLDGGERWLERLCRQISASSAWRLSSPPTRFRNRPWRCGASRHGFQDMHLGNRPPGNDVVAKSQVVCSPPRGMSLPIIQYSTSAMSSDCGCVATRLTRASVAAFVGHGEDGS